MIQNKIRFIGWVGMVAGLLTISAPSAKAFALLGPYEPWMAATNGLRAWAYVGIGTGQTQPGDIGGPMDITNEYRWNVPVVTYGFDQSFLDYFGTNGVAAVTGAIQILNALPRASQIILTNYPVYSTGFNFLAQSQMLYDLKSETLSLLLEQMGLTQPTRYVFVLKQWSPAFIPTPPNYDQANEAFWLDWAIPDYIVQRNFDPQTLYASSYVNSTFYAANVYSNPNSIQTYKVDPLANQNSAVADFYDMPGGFYKGLTFDDVGGLSYLLSPTNFNYETLLSGVVGAGTNSTSWVNGAWRPGVDKITFVPQPTNSQPGIFAALTNYFVDSYLTDGILCQQQMARVIPKPDILFSVKDLYALNSYPEVDRTGTTNWINNAGLNGNLSGAGPGIIQPSINIFFKKAGQTYFYAPGYPDGATDETVLWGSFDGSTNLPVIYPVAHIGTNQTTIRMWLWWNMSMQKSFDWPISGLAGTQFDFQSSSNLVDWQTLFTATNNGTVCTFLNSQPVQTSGYFRLIPQ